MDKINDTLHTQTQYRLVEALHNSETRYKQLLDSLSEIIFSLDENDCFEFTNLAWERHTGHLLENTLGHPLHDFMPDEDYRRFKEYVSLKGSNEFRILGADGNPIWCELLSSPTDGGQTYTLLNVNTLKQTTNTLLTNERHFRNIVESLTEIVFQTDQYCGINFINSAWFELTGYNTEETLGKSLLAFAHENDQEKLNQFLSESSLLAGFNPRLTVRLNCKKGDYRWVAVKAKWLNNAQANLPSPITGTMLDITDQVESEQNLRLSEERCSLIASATTDGVWDWDLETDKVYFSPRWKAMLGYEDHEIKNAFASWYQRVHPDDIDKAMDDVMDCVEGKKTVYENVHRIKHRDGRWLWILDRGVILRKENGLPFRMVGSHADLTQLKQAESKLAQREEELEIIVGLSPDGIVTINAQGLIQSVNAAFLELTGFKQKELLGKQESKLNTLLLKSSGQNSSTRIAIGQNQKIYYIQKADTPLQVNPKVAENSLNCLVLSRTERLLKNQRISKILYFRDISIENHINEMKSQFLSTAAHELRTPMASVYGFSELLLSQEFDSNTTREIASIIYGQAKSLSNMLNQLLDLSRIESRRGLDFNIEKQDLWPILNKSAQQLLIPNDERKVIIRDINLDYKVNVDADKLMQVLSNILANAYKYSPQGGEIIMETLVRSPSQGEMEIGISIRDQGIGMTQNQVKHVFERFWRANHSETIPGTGLGMSLVKEIIDIHQGKIDITSELGVGTTVIVWLKAFKPARKQK